MQQSTEKRYLNKCIRCGHEWLSRDETPLRCAKCKTPYWNIPPKQDNQNTKEDNNA